MNRDGYTIFKNLPCYGVTSDGWTMPSELWRGYHSIAYLSKLKALKFTSLETLQSADDPSGVMHRVLCCWSKPFGILNEREKKETGHLWWGNGFVFAFLCCHFGRHVFLPRGQRTLSSSKLPSDVNSRRVVRLQNPSIN